MRTSYKIITIPLRQHFPVDFLPFNLVKTIVKHPFANGNHTTFLKMVIWAMVQMALSYPDYIVFFLFQFSQSIQLAIGSMYGIYANKTGVFLDGKCHHDHGIHGIC